MDKEACKMVLDSSAVLNLNCSAISIENAAFENAAFENAKKQSKKSRPGICLESGVFLPR
jgi:hypothetical protein